LLLFVAGSIGTAGLKKSQYPQTVAPVPQREKRRAGEIAGPSSW
jgi:hypothetical protein